MRESPHPFLTPRLTMSGKNDLSDEIAPATLDLLDRLAPGKIRSYEDITDIAGLVASGLLLEEISRQNAKELRGWAEVMYTCVAANSGTKDGAGSTTIQQLIQLSQQPNSTIDVTEAIIPTFLSEDMEEAPLATTEALTDLRKAVLK